MALGESVDGEAEDSEIDGDVRAIEDGKTEGHQLDEVGDISQLPAVDAIAKRHRFAQAAQGRSYLMEASELDQAMHKATLQAHNKADQQMFQQITTSAGWVGEDIARIGQRITNKCLLCGRSKKMHSMGSGSAHW